VVGLIGSTLVGGPKLDATLDEHERSLYAGWIHSPSVASSDPVEMILAFKIGRLLNYPGSRVLKALRGRSGLDAEMVRRVEEFVAEESNLEFEWQGKERRIRLIGEATR
jgi:hypothetical protein